MASASSSLASDHKNPTYDSDKDGQVDGDSVQVDGVSIVSTSNILEAVTSQTLIGDFEVSLGNWSQKKNDLSISRTSNHAHRGSTSVSMDDDNTSNVFDGITRTFDLTDIPMLVVHFKITSDSGNEYRVQLDGNVEFSDSGAITGNWYRVEIDTSGYSGSTTIDVGFVNSGTANGHSMVFDDIFTESTKFSETVDSGAGN